MQKIEIKTQRLILKEITEEDAEQIVFWRSNPNVYKYFRSPHELTLEEHIKWYEQTYLLDNAQIQFVAYENTSQQAIGVFGIRRYPNIKSSVEVSYLLDVKAQGNGFSKEAVLGIIKFAKENWRATSAIAEIHKDNYASIKMIERLGFKRIEDRDSFGVYERNLCYT